MRAATANSVRIPAALSFLMHALAILSLMLVHLRPVTLSVPEEALEMVFSPPVEPVPIPDIAPPPLTDGSALPADAEPPPPTKTPPRPEMPAAPPFPSPPKPLAAPPPPTRRPLVRTRTATAHPPRPQEVRASAAGPSAPASLAAPTVAAVAARLVPPGAIVEQQTVQPVYPESARQHREQGEVLLRVEVAADGKPVRVSVARSSGFQQLDDAAAAAVGRWRFRPATHDGMPVSASAEVPVRFRLTN